jgi:MOSC domain-containing protein YiiM
MTTSGGGAQPVSEDRPGGQLVSVNVGLPQDVAWHGQTVHTAVWKRPVEGPRLVRRLNIDGDGQGDLAGHGGPNRAVFVYQLESYQYWQQQLGRDDSGPSPIRPRLLVRRATPG